MNLKKLKIWINSLPEKFDDHQVIIRTITDFGDDKHLFYDDPIVTAGVDEETNEVYFLNSESAKIFSNDSN